jgi:hypothetical protein
MESPSASREMGPGVANARTGTTASSAHRAKVLRTGGMLTVSWTGRNLTKAPDEDEVV